MGEAAETERQARLAEALRENLKRRKEAARAKRRAVEEDATASAPEPSGETGNSG